MTYKVFLFNDDYPSPPQWWVNYSRFSLSKKRTGWLKELDDSEGIQFECGFEDGDSKPRNRYVIFRDMAHYYKFMMKWSSK